jgi:WD40 repeat protein
MKIPLSFAISISAIFFLSACGGGSSYSGGGGGTGGATHFAVTAPGAATAGTAFTITVVALNSSNQTVTGYSGTVHFTSSDAQAVLPTDSNLANGMENVSVTLESTGSSTIVATDTAKPTITGSSSAIQVATNPNLHGFQATGAMGGERASHIATLLADGKVLVAGGTDSLGNDLATAELFDPSTGTFTATGNMISSRISFAATLLAHGPAATNGKVLVTGGTADNTAELFDPSTGTFAATGTPISPRLEGTATLLPSGKVLLAGGHSSTAELFDPATGAFAATGHMISAREECTATLLNDGTVLIVGGDGGPNLDSIITAELFDPATGTFTATGSLTEARSGHSATLLNNGKVLVTGGINSNGDVSTTAEIFDPASGTFSAVGPMSSGHAFHTATLLDDGTVLVVGGFVFPDPPGDGSVIAETFDPATLSFAPTGSLGTARYLHTATKLNNGEVLVTGGEFKTTPTMILKSAELYK